jgi:hypothetical protein
VHLTVDVVESNGGDKLRWMEGNDNPTIIRYQRHALSLVSPCEGESYMLRGLGGWSWVGSELTPLLDGGNEETYFHETFIVLPVIVFVLVRSGDMSRKQEAGAQALIEGEAAKS